MQPYPRTSSKSVGFFVQRQSPKEFYFCAADQLDYDPDTQMIRFLGANLIDSIYEFHMEVNVPSIKYAQPVNPGVSFILCCGDTIWEVEDLPEYADRSKAQAQKLYDERVEAEYKKLREAEEASTRAFKRRIAWLIKLPVYPVIKLLRWLEGPPDAK